MRRSHRCYAFIAPIIKGMRNGTFSTVASGLSLRECSVGEIQLKISLIDYNGKYQNNANLALRKIKAYYSALGHEIGFGLSNPDKIFVSKVFQDNGYQTDIGGQTCNDIEFGGPGYDVTKLLPPEIEHTCPDYEGLGFSMGRTSWGCPRKCEFCMTWRMEGTKTIEHSPFDEFVRHDKVLLYDANFLNSPKCIEKIQTILDNNWKVSFNQGLDLRLMTAKIARKLASVKYYDFDFRDRRLYFAWDLMKNEKTILRGLKTILKFIPARHLMIYILCGFDTSFEEDRYRFEKLKNLGVDPYVMLYNHTQEPQLGAFARYVNRRVYKVCSWEDYDDPRKTTKIPEQPPLKLK